MTDATREEIFSLSKKGTNKNRFFHSKWNQLMAAVTILSLILIVFFILQPRPQWQQFRMATLTYTVQKHDTLYSISQKYPGLLPIDIALMNNDSQLALYPAVCTQTAAKQIATWPLPMSRNGDFCNPSLRLYWQNTLVPGVQLRLPATSFQDNPASQLVAKMGIGNIVLLVDADSGFQRNLDAAVAMHVAMQQMHKHLVGIWIYRDNSLFEYKNGSNAFSLGGNYAGLNGALNMLKMQSNADLAQIALITGNAGKNWAFDLFSDSKPVFGLCTSPDCFGPMGKLAKKTRGLRG